MNVGISAAVADDTDDPEEGDGDRDVFLCRALIDTGAEQSSISLEVAEALELEPSGWTLVDGVTGRGDGTEYTVHVHLARYAVEDTQEPPAGELFDIKGEIEVLGLEGKHIWGDYDVIIGMDILSLGSLVINPVAGSYWFSV